MTYDNKVMEKFFGTETLQGDFVIKVHLPLAAARGVQTLVVAVADGSAETEEADEAVERLGWWIYDDGTAWPNLRQEEKCFKRISSKMVGWRKENKWCLT